MVAVVVVVVRQAAKVAYALTAADDYVKVFAVFAVVAVGPDIKVAVAVVCYVKVLLLLLLEKMLR